MRISDQRISDRTPRTMSRLGAPVAPCPVAATTASRKA